VLAKFAPSKYFILALRKLLKGLIKDFSPPVFPVLSYKRFHKMVNFLSPLHILMHVVSLFFIGIEFLYIYFLHLRASVKLFLSHSRSLYRCKDR